MMQGVPQASAVVPGVVDLEQTNMVKLASSEDSGYKSLSRHLLVTLTNHGPKRTRRRRFTMRLGAWGSRGQASMMYRSNLAKTLITFRYIALANTQNAFVVGISLSAVYETEHLVVR